MILAPCWGCHIWELSLHVHTVAGEAHSARTVSLALLPVDVVLAIHVIRLNI